MADAPLLGQEQLDVVRRAALGNIVKKANSGTALTRGEWEILERERAAGDAAATAAGGEWLHSTWAALARAVGTSKQVVDGWKRKVGFPDAPDEVEVRLWRERQSLKRRRGAKLAALSPPTAAVRAELDRRRPTYLDGTGGETAKDRADRLRQEREEFELAKAKGQYRLVIELDEERRQESAALLAELLRLPAAATAGLDLEAHQVDEVRSRLEAAVAEIRDRLAGISEAMGVPALVSAALDRLSEDRVVAKRQIPAAQKILLDTWGVGVAP